MGRLRQVPKSKQSSCLIQLVPQPTVGPLCSWAQPQGHKQTLLLFRLSTFWKWAEDAVPSPLEQSRPGLRLSLCNQLFNLLPTTTREFSHAHHALCIPITPELPQPVVGS